MEAEMRRMMMERPAGPWVLDEGSVLVEWHRVDGKLSFRVQRDGEELETAWGIVSGVGSIVDAVRRGA